MIQKQKTQPATQVCGFVSPHANTDPDSLGLELFRIAFLWGWNAPVEYETDCKYSHRRRDKLHC